MSYIAQAPAYRSPFIQVTGVFWVDFLPFLEHIPTWVSGATARKSSEKSRPIYHTVRDLPFQAAKSNFVSLSLETEGTCTQIIPYSLMVHLRSLQYVAYSRK